MTAAARLAVSVGCPSGVGPEVSVVAAVAARARVLLVGDARIVARAAELRRIDASRFVEVARPELGFRVGSGKVAVWQPTPRLRERDARFGRPSPEGGAAQLAWIDAGCDLVSRGDADALVTGPVSKDAVARSSAPGAEGFLGHTEHLQRRLGAREVVMAFWTRRLTTALVTTHLPLAAVPRAITARAVATGAFWLGDLLARLAGRRAPRVAIAALNPHAGESGLLGVEEARAIAPGIDRARARLTRAGRDVTLAGPIPAESAFRVAANGAYDGVLAMYHDQATIPMKLLGFGEAVNVSLGLPIVRTSVDHGTAYDIAGTGAADARGMGEALALAARLSRSR